MWCVRRYSGGDTRVRDLLKHSSVVVWCGGGLCGLLRYVPVFCAFLRVSCVCVNIYLA